MNAADSQLRGVQKCRWKKKGGVGAHIAGMGAFRVIAE
jgi:hypothetical protein